MRISEEAKQLFKLTKVMPTNTGGQWYGLGKPKGNMAAPEGRRELGETDLGLKKVTDTVNMETSSRWKPG